MPQKLSPKAAKAKAERDLEFAKTPRRRKMKAGNQRRRRKKLEELQEEGLSPTQAKAYLKRMDYDHEDQRWEERSKNRGNDGNGTKSEGKRKYKA
jgi:hypothetical protein